MLDDLGQHQMDGFQRGNCHGALLRRQRVKGEIIGIGERVMITGCRSRLIERFRGEKLSHRPGDFHGALDVEGDFLLRGWVCKGEYDQIQHAVYVIEVGVTEAGCNVH